MSTQPEKGKKAVGVVIWVWEGLLPLFQRSEWEEGDVPLNSEDSLI